MRWAGHVAHTKVTNVYQILVGGPEGKKKTPYRDLGVDAVLILK
jgi:hypothetical protein